MGRDIFEWQAQEIMPHEPQVRGWLRRSSFIDADEDDVIQEAYCRLSGVTNHERIHSGRAYFFVTVRNILLEELRRSRLIRIESVAEIESVCILDEEPSADRILSGQQRLMLVKELIEGLPDRCRRIFIMRKIDGLSQRETAQRLAVTENVVEKQLAAGLRAISGALAERDASTHGSVVRWNPSDRQKRQP